MVRYSDFIIIGKIGRTNPKDLTLNVHPLTDYPERFRNLQIFRILDENEQRFVINKSTRLEDFVIDKVVISSNNLRIGIKGYSTVSMCSTLQGYYVGIHEKYKVVLPENRFFYFEMIGMDVYDMDKNIGKLISVEDYGSGDILKIKTFKVNGKAEKNIYVPFVKEFVTEVNLQQRILRLKLIDGFY